MSIEEELRLVRSKLEALATERDRYRDVFEMMADKNCWQDAIRQTGICDSVCASCFSRHVLAEIKRETQQGEKA